MAKAAGKISSKELLALIEKGNAVQSARLEEIRTLAEQHSDVNLFSRHCLARKLLTRWQITQLSRGVWQLSIGKYRLLDELGIGRIGRELIAEHVSLGRRVAIKLVSRVLTSDPARLQRFLADFRKVAAIDHPNLVHSFDVDQESQRYFVVTEYLDGENLQQRIDREDPLPVETALKLLRQAAEGLSFAASQGMIHGDFKPTNLLVDKRGNLKVTDLGYVRLIDGSEVKSNKAKESPDSLFNIGVEYRAPEQDDGSADWNDSRIDIFSFGQTLYFLLTGSAPPPPDGDFKERAKSFRDTTECSEEVAQFFAKLTSPKIEDRVKTWSEVISLLERLPEMGGAASDDETEEEAPPIIMPIIAPKKEAKGSTPVAKKEELAKKEEPAKKKEVKAPVAEKKTAEKPAEKAAEKKPVDKKVAKREEPVTLNLGAVDEADEELEAEEVAEIETVEEEEEAAPAFSFNIQVTPKEAKGAGKAPAKAPDKAPAKKETPAATKEAAANKAKGKETKASEESSEPTAEQTPEKKKAGPKKIDPKILMIAGGSLALVVLLVGGLGAWFMFGGSGDKPKEVASNKVTKGDDKKAPTEKSKEAESKTTTEAATKEANPTEVNPAEVNPAEVNPAEVNPAEVNPTPMPAKENTAEGINAAPEINPVEPTTPETKPVEPAAVAKNDTPTIDLTTNKVNTPDKPPAAEKVATKTETKPATPKEIDPFEKLKEMVELPPLTETQPCDFGPFAPLPGKIIQVVLYGAETATKGKQQFKLDDTKEGEWSIWISGKAGMEPTKVATLLPNSQGNLAFSWTSDAASQPLAASLENCVLWFSQGSFKKEIHFRNPVEIDVAPIDLDKPASYKFTLDNLPDVKFVRIELLASKESGFPNADFKPESKMEPGKGNIYLWFGDDLKYTEKDAQGKDVTRSNMERTVGLRFDSTLSSKNLEIRMMSKYRIDEVQPEQTFVPKAFKVMKEKVDVSANFLVNNQKAIDDLKGEEQKKKEFAIQLAQATELQRKLNHIAAIREMVHQKATLHVRVVYDMGEDRKLVLAQTKGAPPLPQPGKKK